MLTQRTSIGSGFAAFIDTLAERFIASGQRLHTLVNNVGRWEAPDPRHVREGFK